MGKDKKIGTTPKIATSTNKFNTAVDADLPGAYCPGLGAIKGSERNKFIFYHIQL